MTIRRSAFAGKIVCLFGLLALAASAPASALPDLESGFIYGKGSDTCNSGAGAAPVTQVTADTDCNQLSATDSAWSVQIRGLCIDIADKPVAEACRDLVAQLKR